MTRSAILATQLLSVGVPARVVQFVPVDDKGHTLVEVWDNSVGWAVVDPSTGGYVVGASSRAAIDLLAQPASVDWRPFGFTKADEAEIARQNDHFRHLLAGNVLYPEPWLYLRVGERIAPWPFRGEYARVGAPFLTLGPLQLFLFWSIPTIALLGVALCATSWWRSAPASEAAGRSRFLLASGRWTGSTYLRTRLRLAGSSARRQLHAPTPVQILVAHSDCART
jgi:hypothetical protein